LKEELLGIKPKLRWIGVPLSLCAVAIVVWSIAYVIGEILLRQANNRLTAELAKSKSTGNETVAATLPKLQFEKFLEDPEMALRLSALVDDARWKSYTDGLASQPVSTWTSEAVMPVFACLAEHADVVAEIDGLARDLHLPKESEVEIDFTKRDGKFTNLLHVLSNITHLRVYEGNFELAENYILLLFVMATRMDESDLLVGSLGCRFAFNTTNRYFASKEPSPEFLQRLKSAVERFPDQIDALPGFLRNTLAMDDPGGSFGYSNVVWRGALYGIPEWTYESPVGSPIRRIDVALSINYDLATIAMIERDPLQTWMIMNQRESAGTIFPLPARDLGRTGARAYAELEIETQARINLLLTVIEIEGFCNKYNRYPTSLNELACPMSIDPFSNKPLLYTRSPMNLYSRGSNCVDDHGSNDDLGWRGFRELSDEE